MMSAIDVGSRLRNTREGLGITIEIASKATRIHARHLSAIESGNFETIASGVQLKGFLRTYAEFLGLDTREIIAALTELQLPPEFSVEDINKDPVGIEQPRQILEEIGAILATQREVLELTLEEAAEHTHIPAHYLKQIEEGDFDSFPSPAQARGMLGSYARFLQADERMLLLRFADSLQLKLANKQEVTRSSRLSQRSNAPEWLMWLRTHISREFALISVTSIVLFVTMLYIIGQVLTTREQFQPAPTAPPLANVLLPTETPPITPSPLAEASPTSSLVIVPESLTQEGPATIPAGGQAPIQLFIIVRQRAYLKVTADGDLVFDGRVTPGENLPFSAQDRIEVLTGNGAGIEFFLNQQSLGTLGILGEVVNILFTSAGVITPTPSITPTAISTTPTP